VIDRASAGFRRGKVSTDNAISRKFTSIDDTRMSTPRKKSPARWLPRMPSVAIAPLARMATCGVRKMGCTEAMARGKIPSPAHANSSRETASSIAGRSLASATARLRNRVEADEGREEDGGGGEERPCPRRCVDTRDRPPIAREHRGGEIGVVEREASDDDHAGQDEGEKHQRHHQSFVDRHADQ